MLKDARGLSHALTPAPASSDRDVVALLVVADQLPAVALGDLLDQERRAAVRALLRHRPVPEREVAVRIVGAAEEHAAAARLALDDVAAVFRAEDAGRLLLHVLAGRIVAARRELAEPALLEHEVRLALRALLVEDLIRLGGGQPLLGRDDLPRRLALGIAGAGEELAEAAALERHRLAAVLARLLDLPPSAPASGVSSSRVFSHSGYALQARNRPNLPALITIGEPHLSHATFGSGSTPSFRLIMSLAARFEILLELLVEARTASTRSRSCRPRSCRAPLRARACS